MDSKADATQIISIHALLAESDTQQYRDWRRADISIHALLAESDVIRNFADAFALQFLSTLSLRRATPLHDKDVNPDGISIHALLAESDSKSAQNSGALLRI